MRRLPPELVVVRKANPIGEGEHRGAELKITEPPGDSPPEVWAWGEARRIFEVLRSTLPGATWRELVNLIRTEGAP